MAATERSLAGLGLGWRRELAAPLLTSPRAVGFVEVIAESCLNPGPLRREVLGLAEIWPVLPHGIKLSLGSADGIDEHHARRLGELARALRAPLMSEHVAFTRGRDRDIGHLTQLPLHRSAVAVVARNLAKARRLLPDIPFLLENPAWTLRWPEDEMDEGSFFHEIVHATGCELLLDIANLYANAQNSGRDPLSLLRSYPLNRVAMVHIAGGAWREGFYVDTHCHPTPSPVFDLLRELVRIRGPLPVVLERDGRYPPFAELAAELAQAQSILEGVPVHRAADESRRADPTHVSAQIDPRPDSDAAVERRISTADLAAQQVRLAQLLTQAARPAASYSRDEAVSAPPSSQPEPRSWDPRELDRSRSVLLHKRVDEAIDLLWRIRSAAEAQHIDLYGLALERLGSLPPARRLPTVIDALWLARSLKTQRALATAAELDELTLQARFVEHSEGASARFWPYLAKTQRAHGGKTWVWKPLGPRSPLRFFSRPAQGLFGGSPSRTS